MNKQQMIEAGRAEGVSDKVIQRRLVAAGFSPDLDAVMDAATYEQRHDAIVARYNEGMQRIQREAVALEQQATAEMLALNAEFGIDGEQQQAQTPTDADIDAQNEENTQTGAAIVADIDKKNEFPGG